MHQFERQLARALGIVLATGMLWAPSATPDVPSSAAAAAAAPASAEPTAIRVGTYNIRAKVELDAFQRAVDAVKPEVDVVGLQEIGSNERNRYLVADRDWGYYRPPQLQQNPVIWDRSVFDLLEARGRLIAEKRDLNGEHTGDPDKGASWATVVRLRHRLSGQLLSFVNVHLVRGAVRGGRPIEGRPRLFRLYTDQVEGLVRAVRREQTHVDRVYALGDFNAGYESDRRQGGEMLPFRRFREIGYRSMWQRSPYLDEPLGTRNDSLIDQVWNPADPETEEILRSVDASDHWPAVATYHLPSSSRRPPAP